MSKQPDAPLHMYRSYHRDNSCPGEILKEHYPKLLASDRALAHAVAMIDVAEAAIAQRMLALAAEDEDE